MNDENGKKTDHSQRGSVEKIVQKQGKPPWSYKVKQERNKTTSTVEQAKKSFVKKQWRH